MMNQLNLQNDFAQIIDDLEPVTLRRRDSPQTLQIDSAYRLRGSSQELSSSGGAVLQTDAVWQLQIPAGEAGPQLGDVVVDQQQNRWTILVVQRLDSLGRWKCSTRELRIAFACHDLVDIDRPVWGENGGGAEIVSWTRICVALPVHIQLDEMILDTSTNPPTKQLLYEIVLSESGAIEPDDRLTAKDGASYRVQSLQQADRIDVLPMVKAIREIEG